MVTLVLYYGHEKRWDKPLTLREAANVPEMFQPFVPDMKDCLKQKQPEPEKKSGTGCFSFVQTII